MVGSNPRTIRCVVVGDGAVGKTSMLLNYTTKGYSADYVPTFYDNFNVSMACLDETYAMNLVDTSGQETYDRLRTLAYCNTDLFIVCFSLVNPTSFENLTTRWMPELKEYKPNTPFMLVGTHLDLREKLQDKANRNNNNNNNSSMKDRQHHHNNRFHLYRHDDDEAEDGSKNSSNTSDNCVVQQIPPPSPSSTHHHHRNSHHNHHSHYLRSARRRFSWVDSSTVADVTGFVLKRKASKWAKRHGAASYIECSSVTGEGVDEVFQVALDHVLAPKKESYFRKSLRKFFWKV